MSGIEVLFWDIGGVLLTNGWDRYARQAASARFGIDRDDFEERHEACIQDFETGRISLEDYLARTLFYEPRSFTKADFETFMFAQSQPHPEMLALARSLQASGSYRMAMLNNEPLELNRYRIQAFDLRSLFDVFLSSCYLGLRKPDTAIYQKALELTQVDPGKALLIDDRAENLLPARELGFHTIRHTEGAESLRPALRKEGIDA